MDGTQPIYTHSRTMPSLGFEKVWFLPENGSAWPKQLLQATGHLLQKPESDEYNPLSFRVLTITPGLYRLWAKIRLQHLASWTETWILPQMFAGIPGVGSQDAWFSTSIDLENAQTQNLSYVGGALDMYKCFDQVLRPLLSIILSISGIPVSVLSCYASFQENVMLRFQILGTLGTPHKHPWGIPQGCPFSMCFIALYLRALICQMVSMGVTIRVLADDLLVTVFGENVLRLFFVGFEQAMQHIKDLGGVLLHLRSRLLSPTLVSIVNGLKDLSGKL